jgi:NADH-quinone oxidoreductase subunit C
LSSADTDQQTLLDTLTAALGDAVVESRLEKGDLWVRVRTDAWRAAAEACRDRLACDYFCFLSGIDWMPSQVPNPEEAAAAADEEDEEEAPLPSPAASQELRTGYAGGDSRFQVFARYYSTTTHQGVTVKADLDEADPTVESIVAVYRGADWHEREAWEMYGFRFAGHDDLRHLYLPGEFEGHPLRKDFPLLAREVKPWPGLVDVEPMPGGDGDEAEEGEAE